MTRDCKRTELVDLSHRLKGKSLKEGSVLAANLGFIIIEKKEKLKDYKPNRIGVELKNEKIFKIKSFG